MGFIWGASSRLTFKRQKGCREEGNPREADLGQAIRGIQREAAALSDDVLLREVEVNLAVQDAAIRYFLSIGPGPGAGEDLVTACDAVWFSALATALYVRELASRPADRIAVVFRSN
jgi:hypothetical protein